METRIQFRYDNSAPVEPLSFTWYRWNAGFHLHKKPSQTWPDREFEFLDFVDGGRSYEIYRPLEDAPDLALEFHSVRSSSDVLSFANRYGLLRQPSGAKWLHETEESVTEWLNAAASVKRVLEFWRLIDAKNLPALRKLVRWKDKASVWVCDVPLSIVPSRSKQRWREGDILGPAKLYLADQINRRLRAAVNRQLTIDSLGNIRPYNTPTNLLSAIWFRLSEIVTGERLIRRCEAPDCLKLMDVTDNRSHKRMHDRCSLRLRMQKFRRKHV